MPLDFPAVKKGTFYVAFLRTFYSALDNVRSLEPTESTLDYPTMRQDLKSFCVRWTTYDFHAPAKLLFDPSDNIFIGTFSPDQFETTPAVIDAVLDALKQFRQNQLATITVRNACPMD